MTSIITNIDEINLSNKIKLFTPIDETIYIELAILYNTLEQSNILSTEFLEHRMAFIDTANKCFIDITKSIQK